MRFKYGLFAAMSMFVMLGCTDKARSVLEWREEVRIGTSEVVVIDRKEALRHSTEAGGPASNWIVSSELRAYQLGKLPPFPPLQTEEFLVVLDFDSAAQNWHVISFVENCYRARELGLGNRPYFEYTLKDGAWNRQPLSDRWVGTRANLLLTKELAQSGSTVLIGQKEVKDTYVGLPDYLKSVRAKVPC